MHCTYMIFAKFSIFSWKMVITFFGVLAKFSQLIFILDLWYTLYYECIFLAHSWCVHKYLDKISWFFPDFSPDICSDQPQFRKEVYSHIIHILNSQEIYRQNHFFLFHHGWQRFWKFRSWPRKTLSILLKSKPFEIFFHCCLLTQPISHTLGRLNSH